MELQRVEVARSPVSATTGNPDNLPMSSKRPRGRPPKTPATCLKAKFWYLIVDSLGWKKWRSAYGREKHYSASARKLAAEGRSPLRGDKVWVPSNKARKHQNGVLASPDHIAEVDLEFPGTARLTTIPHWEIMDVPAPSVERLRELLTGLRPGIVEILFRRDANDRWQRRLDMQRTLRRLDRESDFDALVACLGLMRELEASDCRIDIAYFDVAVAIRRIFMRLAATAPFSDFAPTLLTYLRTHFLKENYGSWSLGIDDIAEHLADHRELRHGVILMAEDLFLIDLAERDALGCLYVADRLGITNVFEKLWHYTFKVADWRTCKQDPLLKVFVRRFRRLTPKNAPFALLEDIYEKQMRR